MMRRIKSFEIDHTKLRKGLYVSRYDSFGLSCVTTFDLRMKTPYVDTPLKPATAHTLEHCLATYLRNNRGDVIYVGPMGCMTGFYVVVAGRKSVLKIRKTIIEALEWILRTNSIPGATMKECGNYTFMDLADARREAAAYIEVLRSPTCGEKYEE